MGNKGRLLSLQKSLYRAQRFLALRRVEMVGIESKCFSTSARLSAWSLAGGETS